MDQSHRARAVITAVLSPVLQKDVNMHQGLSEALATVTKVVIDQLFICINHVDDYDQSLTHAKPLSNKQLTVCMTLVTNIPI